MEQERPDLDRHDHVLLGLVMNLQASAMIQLGKMSDPISGELKRDLDAARAAIDLLEALQAKCKGNLAVEATALLDRVVMDLQLNYADERRKGDEEPSADAPAETDEEAAAEGETDAEA